MKITCCEKVCNECAFNGNSENTLYAESYNIIDNFMVFPCHIYLKSKTGYEHLGTESLKEIKACRGYVAFMKKYHRKDLEKHEVERKEIWNKLFNQIKENELNEILNIKELEVKHYGLRDRIYLGN